MILGRDFTFEDELKGKMHDFESFLELLCLL